MYTLNQNELEELESIAAHIRKSHSARCGHVKRRILAGERLTGKTLKFALEVLESQTGFSDQAFLLNIAEKLKKGSQLDDYEEHIMVDVILLHAKLRLFS